MNRRIPPPAPAPTARAAEQLPSGTCAACGARPIVGGLRHRDASDRPYCESCTRARQEWAEAAFATLVVLYLACLTGASLLGTLTTRGIGLSTLVALFSARAAWIFSSRLVPRVVAPALAEHAEKVSP